MDSTQHSDVAWLRTLDPVGRARFFAHLGHNLTISGRAVAIDDAPAETRLERLRQLNEIQHRVSSYTFYALTPKENLSWLPTVAQYVLEPTDEKLRRATAWAWNETRAYFAAVP